MRQRSVMSRARPSAYHWYAPEAISAVSWGRSDASAAIRAISTHRGILPQRNDAEENGRANAPPLRNHDALLCVVAADDSDIFVDIDARGLLRDHFINGRGRHADLR